MVHSPSLVQGVYSKRSDYFSYDEFLNYIFVNVFGGPKRSWKQLGPIVDKLTSYSLSHILREPSLSNLVDITVKNIEDHAGSFVSFMPGSIDQSYWERTSGATPTRTHDGRPAMEVSLMPIVRDFLGVQAVPSIFGTDLPRNHPTLLSDIWAFDDALILFMTSLPRWLPIPSLGRAYAARARLHAALAQLNVAMDDAAAGRPLASEWADVDNVGEVLKSRARLYREHDVSLAVRAVADLTILWGLMANANFAAFWLLLRILATPGLGAAVLAETAPFVTLEPRGDGGFGVEQSPRLQIDHRGLAASCPLLKSCYVESLRLDSAPWAIKKVTKDFTLTEKAEDLVGAHAGDTPQTYSFKAGTFVEVPIGLHMTDPKYFEEPDTFIPDRHIKKGKDGEEFVEWGSVKPYGGGKTICKGRLFAEREIMANTVALLAMWEFEPVDEQGWKLPGHVRSSGVSKPDKDVRVRVSRRRF